MRETAPQRHNQITHKAKELLTDKSLGSGTHRFLISANEAVMVGEAVSHRDYRALNEILSSAVDGMRGVYHEMPIDSVQSAWERSLQQTTDLPGDTLEFIQSNTHREGLIHLFEDDSYGDALDMDPIVYVKMLETIAYASAPDVPDFKEQYFTARNCRKGTDERALFSRTMLTLRTLSDQEPGIRNVREKLLDDDASGVDEYLRRLSTMMLAREAYGTIVDDFSDGQANTMREAVCHELGALHADEELALTHLLSWTILPPEISEKRDKRALKQAAMERAVSDYQRKRLEEDWSDERVEFIFDTARLGHEARRNPQIYISNTFDNGAGLYLAVGLTHPQDVTKQIVIADNPVNGNALYFVDELNTENHHGTPYAWNEVLGTSKRLARDRGATRRYHTGNWVEVAHAVCEYTGEHNKPRRANDAKTLTPASGDLVTPRKNQETMSGPAQLEAAIKLAREVMQNIRLR